MGDRNRKGRRTIKTHSAKTGLPRHVAASLVGEAYTLRMAKGQRNKRKPSLPKMPWEEAKQ